MFILALSPFSFFLGQCLVQRPMKDLTILFNNFHHQGRAKIYAQAQVSTQSEMVIGVSCCFISKHYSYKPFKLTKLDNVGCFTRHYDFRDFPIKFVLAICNIGPNTGLKLRQSSQILFGVPDLMSFLLKPFFSFLFFWLHLT